MRRAGPGWKVLSAGRLLVPWLLCAAAGAWAQPAPECPAPPKSCQDLQGVAPGCLGEHAALLTAACGAAAQGEQQQRSLQAKLEEQQQRNLALAQQLSDVQKMLGQKESELQTLRSAHADLQREGDRLRLRLEEVDKNRQELEQQRRTLDEQLRGLESKKNEADQAVAQAHSALSEARRLGQQQQQAAEQALRERQRLAEGLSRELSQVLKGKEAVAGDLRRTEAEKLTLRQQKEQVEASTESLRSRLEETDGKLNNLRTAANVTRRLFTWLMVAFLILLTGTFSFIHRSARRRQRHLEHRYMEDAVKPLTELAQTLIRELAQIQAIAEEARRLLRIAMLGSLVGVLAAALSVAFVVSYAEDAVKTFNELVGSALWQILLGFATPTAALVATYTVVQSNLNGLMKLCHEMALFSARTDSPGAQERQTRVA